MTTVREARESDEAVLARLGYRQEFKRNFKPLDVFGNRIQYHRTVAIDSVRPRIRAPHLTFPRLFLALCFRAQYPMEELCQWCGAHV
ncbi:hypothetical protein L210DRAFT_3539815 [Boletus edulis BED1]|uniref:Uncharacterized protein n=1 Tax=Boletus edulis BED1 TaxID=1328754 RepID=A0AAD4BUX0_BOLED|nr:hypothetical protein L210DRAFT_3539815 [Boletus edulis BED1]